MRLEKINDNQIKCILNQFDADDKKLLDGLFFKNSRDIKTFFEKIVLEAKNTLDFHIGTSPLTIESDISKENEVSFIISKSEEFGDLFDFSSLKNKDKNIDKENKLNNKKIPFKEVIPTTKYIYAYEFKSISYLIKLLETKELDTSSIYSDLYKNFKEDKYILVIRIKNNMEESKWHDIRNFIEEFLPSIRPHETNTQFFNENHSLLITNNALQNIEREFINN